MWWEHVYGIKENVQQSHFKAMNKSNDFYLFVTIEIMLHEHLPCVFESLYFLSVVQFKLKWLEWIKEAEIDRKAYKFVSLHHSAI